MQSQVSIQLLKRFYEQGKLHEALDHVASLCLNAGCGASTLYSRLLQCCVENSDFAGGWAIQWLLSRCGLDSDAVLGSGLVRLFASSGRLIEAIQVFGKKHEPNVYLWTAIIAAHAKLGHDERALELYRDMRRSGLDADGHVYLAVLQATAASGSIRWGKVVHSHVLEGSYDKRDAFVCNSLINMYAKCSCLEDAQNMFERSSKLDVVTWNALIAGLVQHGHENKAFDCFQQMQSGGVIATKITFTCMLKACSNLAKLEQGMLIHFFVIEAGTESDSSVSNTLIDLYLRCGSSLDALALYKRFGKRNLVTWNIMVAGLVQQGHGGKALECWADLLKEGANPDRISFVSSLKACLSVGALHEGRLIHMHMLEVDLVWDTSIGNMLLDMYCGCGVLDDARRVFSLSPKQDVVAWNVMMKGMVQHGCPYETLQFFQQLQLEGVLATGFTYVCVLNAFASLRALMHGKVLHACLLASGSLMDTQISNALIDMYIKCKDLSDAYKLFDKSSHHDMVTWNTMLAGYLEQDKGQQAFELFVNLHEVGLEPDRISFIHILKACAAVAALDEGRIVHAYIIDKGMESKTSIVNVIIDMYGKWGTMGDSQRVFDKSPKRDVVTWSALMSGYIEQGEYKLVMKIFESMQHEGVKPDGILLAYVLSASCHLGKVKQAHGYLTTMKEVYGVEPGIDHCNCLIDLLGRAGHLKETQHILENMCFQSNSIGWSSLLWHCYTHGNVELGKICLSNIAETDEEYPTGLVLMSNLCAQTLF